MTSSCARRCALTLSFTTSSAYIRLYATFLRSPLSGSVACNHVSTKAVQDPPPVRAFYLANAGGGGPVNLVSLGHTTAASHTSAYFRLQCASPFCLVFHVARCGAGSSDSSRCGSCSRKNTGFGHSSKSEVGLA